MMFMWFRLGRRRRPSSKHLFQCRVTWGKTRPFGDDLSLTYLFASTSEKKLHVCNKLYVMCIMAEYHMHSNNMSAEIQLSIAALKMSQMWGKAPRGPMIPHNYSK